MKTGLLAVLILGLSATASANDGSVKWRSGSLDETLKAAADEGKMTMAFFWWEGSEAAEAMRASFDTPKLSRAVSDFVCFDANYRADGMKALFEKFAIKISPTAIFFNAQGEPEELLMGQVQAHELVKDIERVAELGEGTITGLNRAIQECKDDEESIELRMSLAGKFDDLGRRDRHDATLVSICEFDPKARTVAGARAHLMRIQNELWDGYEDGGEYEGEGEGEGEEGEEGEGKNRAREFAQSWDLEPVYDLAKKAKAVEARFEVWNAIARLENTKGVTDKSIAAMMEAAKHVSEDQAGDWCNEAANKVMAFEGKRSGKHKKFALDIAQRALKVAEQKAREAEGHQEEWNAYLAHNLETVARAYMLCGKKKQAIDSCKKALELHDSEDIRTTLTSLK